MKKKKLLKRAFEISVDLLCKTECCVVEVQAHCPVETGVLGGCDQCIKRFIMKKAQHEIREDKLRKDIKAIQAQASAARARAKEAER